MSKPVDELAVSRLLFLSFVATILLGALLLYLPISFVPGKEPISWIDALFTATSAVCVTGLGVRDTGQEFSLFGQVVILLLIQVGGLGFLTFSTFVLSQIFRRRQGLSQEQRLLLETSHGLMAGVSPGRLLGTILLFTLIVEALGMLLLFSRFVQSNDLATAGWLAVFHAVSAFCNAGFGLYSDSLMGYHADWLVSGTVMGLIVLGGIGFLVAADVANWLRDRRLGQRARLSLHSRLALITTGWLILGGWLLFAGLEWGGAAMGREPGEVMLNSLFLSVTSRTAGFYTVDTAQLTNASLFVVVVLMAIGGSPGSCAGGFKTTTAAVCVALLSSRARNRPRVEICARSLPEETVTKAMLVVTGFVLAILVGVLLLSITEAPSQPFAGTTGNTFLAHLFEVVSALGTVGLSTGITPNLSDAGKLVLILLMFSGRVGPLLVANVLVGRQRRIAYFYTSENVNIG